MDRMIFRNHKKKWSRRDRKDSMEFRLEMTNTLAVQVFQKN